MGILDKILRLVVVLILDVDVQGKDRKSTTNYNEDIKCFNSTLSPVLATKKIQESFNVN